MAGAFQQQRRVIDPGWRLAERVRRHGALLGKL
jgi:hypothetical protein